MAQHSDDVTKTHAPSSTSQTQQPGAAAKQTNNEAQAALAEQEREREHTTGGDGPAAPRAVTPAPRLDAAIARVKAADRPSPFGTTYFPSLPAPPERR